MLIVFFLFSLLSSLHNLDINPLSDVELANIFLPFYIFIFTQLTFFLTVQKLYFMRSLLLLMDSGMDCYLIRDLLVKKINIIEK